MIQKIKLCFCFLVKFCLESTTHTKTISGIARSNRKRVYRSAINKLIARERIANMVHLVNKVKNQEKVISVFYRPIAAVIPMMWLIPSFHLPASAQVPEDTYCYDPEYIRELYKISEYRAEQYRLKFMLHPEYAELCRRGVRKAATEKRKTARYAASQRQNNSASRASTSSTSSNKYADDDLDDLPPPLIIVTPEKAPEKKAKPRTCTCPVGYDLTYGVCWDHSNGTSMMAGDYPWRDECKAEFGSASTLSYDENGNAILPYNGN